MMEAIAPMKQADRTVTLWQTPDIDTAPANSPLHIVITSWFIARPVFSEYASAAIALVYC